MPSMRAVMTPFPYSIESARTVGDARRMMKRHDIRHLPVVDAAGKLVGVLTARDVERAGSEEKLVGDACGMEAYRVESTERLDGVLREMARRHIGAVLVTKEGRLAGIFTHADACRWFAELLKSVFPRPDGEDAA